MNLKKIGSYLRVNLLGPGPRLVKKKNLPACGLIKVDKHWFITHWHNLLLLYFDHLLKFLKLFKPPHFGSRRCFRL